MPPAAPPTSAVRTTPAPGARVALILLLSINLFNYIDRQVLSAVEKLIADDLLPNDPRAQTKMGWCASAFLISYMVLSPLFGRLADRWSRYALVAFGVTLWTLASGATGLAGSLTVLLLTRAFVGVGEAAWGPVAPALLADLYPESVRGKVMAWFYVAIPVGSALGYALGGLMAHLSGWRSAFLVVVPPGLLLAAWSLFMKDPRGNEGQRDKRIESLDEVGQRDKGAKKLREDATKGLSDKAAKGGLREDNSPPRSPGPSVRQSLPPPKPSLKHDLLSLTKNPSYVLDTVGMIFMTFAIGGISFFMPRYILQSSGYNEARVNLTFGGITVVAGLAATLAGGWLGDRLRPRFPGSYFLVSAAGLGLGFPLFLAMLYTPFPYAWGLLFLTVFALFFNTGPSNTILANVTAPSVRATAFAVNILVIHALGDVTSPVLIGYIADRASLRAAFVVCSFTFLLGAVAWLMGAPYLRRDTDRAAGVLAG